MTSLISFVPFEPPEKRVLEWLKQCSAAPNEVGCSRVECEAPENVCNESELFSDVHQIKKTNVLNAQRSTKTIKRYFRNQSEQSKDKHRRPSESDSGCLTSSTFLRSYTPEENQNIVRYIVENDAFPFLKGTLLWRKMEKEKVCCRSWQSMKTQFIKKIYPQLGEYPLEREEKEKLMQYMKPSPTRKLLHMEPGKKGWRKNGRYYTLEEDLIILKYILQKKRRLKVHGNTMWQTMDERDVLPGRTWQSMRSRYLNVIRHSLDEYKTKDSTIELLMNSKEQGAKSRKKDKGDLPVSCTNTKNVPGKKKANQDIRKYAISTGIQLASKLKMAEKNPGHLKNPNNKIQQTKEKIQQDCSPGHQAASDTESSTFEKQNSFERNEKNDSNGKEVECPLTCNISSSVPNVTHDDASRIESVVENDNASKISDENDNSDIENAESDINSPDRASVPPVNQKQCMQETHTFDKNHSSRNLKNSCDENRNNADCAVPDQVSDSQESFDSRSKLCDAKTPCSEGVLSSDLRIVDETESEASDCEGSFSSRKTLRGNMCDVHRSIQNCVKCSSDHKLSPSSN